MIFFFTEEKFYYPYGLLDNSKSSFCPLDHKQKLLDLSNPGKNRFNTNLMVFMEKNLNYNDSNLIQGEYSIQSGTGEPSNKGIKRGFYSYSEEDISIEQHKRIIDTEFEAKVSKSEISELSELGWLLSLKYDILKLNDSMTFNELKNYLERLCTEGRAAFIDKGRLDMVEQATIDDIFLDSDDTEWATQLKTLHSAIVKATGDKNIDLKIFPLLSKDFIEYLESGLKSYSEYLDSVLKDKEYTDTYCSEYSESEDSTGTTESNNYNDHEPLTNDETQSLTEGEGEGESEVQNPRAGQGKTVTVIDIKEKNVQTFKGYKQAVEFYSKAYLKAENSY